MKEVSIQSQALAPEIEARKPNDGEELENQAVLVREQEDFVAASKVKSQKVKKVKEKIILEVAPTFDSPAGGERRSNRGGNNDRRRGGNSRFGNNSRRGGKAGNSGKKTGAQPTKTVNLSSPDEFPTL